MNFLPNTIYWHCVSLMPNVLCQIEKGAKERKHEDVEGAGRVSARATRANKKAKLEEAYRLIDEDQDQFPIYFAWKSIKRDNLLRSRKMLSSEVVIKFSILGCDGMCQAINTMFMRTLLFSLLSSHSPMMIQFLSISFIFLAHSSSSTFRVVLSFSISLNIDPSFYSLNNILHAQWFRSNTN